MSTDLPSGFARASEMRPAGIMYVPPVLHKPKREKGPPREIRSLQEALDFFRAKVACRRINDVVLDGARVGVVFIREGISDRYLVLFKREPYYRFSKHFPDIPAELRGYGIIANLKLVYWAALEGIRIAAVMKDARIYWIDAWEFYQFYEKYHTDVKHIKDSEEIATPLKSWHRIW